MRKQQIVLGLLIGALFFGCSSKQEQVQKIDPLQNAPKWVLYPPHKNAQIIAVGRSNSTDSDFRSKRDQAFSVAQHKIIQQITQKLSKVFQKIDPNAKYASLIKEEKNELQKQLAQDIRMDALYQTPTGEVYLKAYLTTDSIKDALEQLFTTKLQKFDVLYANYLLLKNSGELDSILSGN